MRALEPVEVALSGFIYPLRTPSVISFHITDPGARPRLPNSVSLEEELVLPAAQLGWQGQWAEGTH